MTTKIKKIIVAILGLFVLSASASSFIQMIPQGVTNDYTALNITTGLGIDPTWEIRAHNTIQGGVSDALSIWGGTSGSEQTALAIDGTNGNIGIGTVAPTAELTVSGRIDQIDIGESTFLGFEAGKVDDLSSNNNTFIGYQSGKATTTGNRNTASGYQSLYSNTTGHNSTASGYQSLYSHTTGYHNTTSGSYSLYSNTTGNYNTAIGNYSLHSNQTGNNNIGLGYYAGKYELGSNAFYINNQNRTNTAGDQSKSLMYGVMAAAAIDQDLTINAELKLNGTIKYTQAVQTLTGAGAVDITSAITHIVTTAADALTLVDGAEGQVKFIIMKTDGGNGTLTPTNYANGATLLFDDVGDSVMLLFTNGSWHWMGGKAT